MLGLSNPAARHISRLLTQNIVLMTHCCPVEKYYKHNSIQHQWQHKNYQRPKSHSNDSRARRNDCQQETTRKLLMAVFTYNQNTFKDVESDELKSALNVLYQTIIRQIQILITTNTKNLKTFIVAFVD